MSKEKHTPGPWVATDEMANDRSICVGDAAVWGPDGDMVADVHGNLALEGDAVANARLIAAAPDLLAALRAAKRYVEGAYECAFPDQEENAAVLRDVNAAIDKSEGGSL
jgi:hypothetical protein